MPGATFSGVRLTVIGSSDAFNSAGRGHSCYWLDGAATKPLVIDFGANALAALGRMGKDPRKIGAILLTHLHGDHTAGIPFLLIDGMFHRVRSEPLVIYGPPGMAGRIEALFRAAYASLADQPRPFALELHELSPGQEVEVAGAKVRVFAASHQDPPDVPLCLRVEGQDGRVVGFSGDTTLCPGLFAAAERADLMVAECTALRPPAGRHITWEDWKAALPRVRAKRLLLTHLGDDVRANAAEIVRHAPVGPSLLVAEDGLALDV